VSRINEAILGVFLDPVHQRMQNPTDHTIQNRMCLQGGIFPSGALQSLSSLTGQQMKKRVQAASAPQGCQIVFLTPNFTNLTFFIKRQLASKTCLAFSHQCKAFCRQLAQAIRLVSWLFKCLAEKCY